MLRTPASRAIAMVLVVLAAGCTNDESGVAENTPVESSTAEATGLEPLPIREGPRRETTHGVPHVQTDAVLVPEFYEELRRRAFSLPGVEDQLSELSMGDTRSLWLSDDIELVRPEVLQSGREFAHIHPNGSLHVWLPVDRAIEAATSKWGELHPWVGREDFWDGMSMVYTPESLEDVDVIMVLIVDAYNYVTGENLDPADFD